MHHVVFVAGAQCEDAQGQREIARRTYSFILQHFMYLGKWLWRYHLEGGSLWKDIIDARYGVDWGGWCSKEVRGGVWCGFMEVYKEGMTMFCKSNSLCSWRGHSYKILAIL